MESVKQTCCIQSANCEINEVHAMEMENVMSDEMLHFVSQVVGTSSLLLFQQGFL